MYHDTILFESNPQVGICSLDLLISASHLVLNDINIDNLYIKCAFR